MGDAAGHDKISSLSGGTYIAFFALGAPLLYLVLGKAADRSIGNFFSPLPLVLQMAGGVLAIAGLALIIISIILLYTIGRGLPISSSPPVELVTAGPYSMSRHPIYLGAMVTFAGTSMMIGSFWCTMLAAPLLGFFYFTYAAGIEEPILHSRYGQRYSAYQNRTALSFEFPLRLRLYRIVSSLLEKLSGVINRPKILRRGNFIFFWGYGIWLAAGAISGLAVIEVVLISLGRPAGDAAWVVAIVMVCGLAGARLMWRTGITVHHGIGFTRSAWKVGYVSWGVLTGYLIGLPLLAWKLNVSPYLFFDVAFPSLMITHSFGRIGCLFYGCCYGKETTSGARIRYTHPDLKAVREDRVNPESLKPVQLISALNGALIAALVFGIWYSIPLPMGVPAALAAATYGLLRIGEEWLRTQHKVMWGFVSPSQFVALLLVLVGVGHLLWIPIGGEHIVHPALSEVLDVSVIAQMHLLLLIVCSVIALFAGSYHYSAVGRWK